MKRLIKVLDENKKTAGFTLIELMIVVIIVGILAAAAVPIYRFAVRRAYESEAKASLGTIRAAELVYHAEKETFLAVDVGDLQYETTDTADGPGLGIDVTHNTWFKTSAAFKVIVSGTGATAKFLACADGSLSGLSPNPVALIAISLKNDGTWRTFTPGTWPTTIP